MVPPGSSSSSTLSYSRLLPVADGTQFDPLVGVLEGVGVWEAAGQVAPDPLIVCHLGKAFSVRRSERPQAAHASIEFHRARVDDPRSAFPEKDSSLIWAYNVSLPQSGPVTTRHCRFPPHSVTTAQSPTDPGGADLGWSPKCAIWRHIWCYVGNPVKRAVDGRHGWSWSRRLRRSL